MLNLYKLSSFLLIFLSLCACSESPEVDFYSYQELMEYEFFSHGWFPVILKEDAFAIRETYDVGNRHAFGRFEFKQREWYEAELITCQPISAGLILEKIDEIERPAFPKWFVSKENISNGQYLLVKYSDFYLITEKSANRIYFFR